MKSAKCSLDPARLVAAINKHLIPAILKQSPEDFKPKPEEKKEAG